MAVSYTTTYNLTKPEVGASEDQWGDLLNTNFDNLDDLLDGTTPITGIDINSGTLDGVTIGGTTAGAGTFTTLTANTSITGTLATAAQPNITSVGSLTSLDVTGTITADGLVFSDGGDRTITGPLNNDLIINSRGNTPGEGTKIQSSGVDRLLVDDTTGDISFYEDTGTTPKFFWDASAESLGIGTSSPASELHLANTSTTITLEDTDNASTNTIVSSFGQLSLRADTGSQQANSRIDFKVDGSEAMRIDSSGNVGIGITPSVKFHVKDTFSALSFEHSGGNAVLKIDGGNGDLSGTDYSSIVDTGGTLLFGTSGGSEAMRIDSSGNLLVGKTVTTYATTGCLIKPQGHVTNANAEAFAFHRTGSDGNILNFSKDGTAVGSIGVVSGNAFFSGVNLGMRPAGTGVVPVNASGASADNAYDIGQAAVRWDDIYATNGTIKTSDENEKQQIASLTDAEITAAKAISKLFKTFKWNDSVAEKGDAARTHTGVIAQQVETAMTNAGLNAGDYAFFISTTWWETQTEVPAVEADEENGVEAQEAYTRTDTYDTAEEAPEGATERNRKGIRYPELLSFIGAATEQRLASIETRLDALEA